MEGAVLFNCQKQCTSNISADIFEVFDKCGRLKMDRNVCRLFIGYVQNYFSKYQVNIIKQHGVYLAWSFHGKNFQAIEEIKDVWRPRYSVRASDRLYFEGNKLDLPEIQLQSVLFTKFQQFLLIKNLQHNEIKNVSSSSTNCLTKVKTNFFVISIFIFITNICMQFLYILLY